MEEGSGPKPPGRSPRRFSDSCWNPLIEFAAIGVFGNQRESMAVVKGGNLLVLAGGDEFADNSGESALQKQLAGFLQNSIFDFASDHPAAHQEGVDTALCEVQNRQSDRAF